jgi:ABC-type glutathione transport system ATPase component
LPPIINAQGISKRFGAAPLFQDISFTVSEGDRIGLIGPNGSGKSTLLRVLAGELEPDTGDVATRKRTKLAYVEQQSEFADRVTVRSVIAEALRRANVPEDERERRLVEWLGRCGFANPRAVAPDAAGNDGPGGLLLGSLTSTQPQLPFPADGASAWRLWKRWCSIPTCCCWMSRRTIWTWRVLSGWKSCSATRILLPWS